MRVLFLSCHLPYPPVSGGRRREWELLRRLGRRHEIHLCAVTKTYCDDRPYVGEVERVCERVTLFEATPREGQGIAPQVGIHHCPQGTAAIAREASDCDVVHVEGFYLAQHVPEDLCAPVALLEQNVEFTLWQQRSRLAGDPAQRKSLMRDAEATRDHELAAWARSTVCAALTDEDRALMSAHIPTKPVLLVPDGADHSSAVGAVGTAPVHAEGPTVVMVGNFAYEPNVDAGLFLCREIAPILARRVPGVQLLLVGNSPPEALRDAAATAGCVGVTGTVPSVEPYLDIAKVVVCPLRIGGGVKVKVLEALMRGKAVVASPVAAQGLGRPGRQAVRIAETGEGITQALVELLENGSRRRKLELAAARYARTLPRWHDAARALEDCWTLAAATGSNAAATG